MATYYIRQSGSDTNNGTSPATAWRTFQKALGSGSPVVGGDTVYVGAGTYRETVTVGIGPTSMVTVIGDVLGAYTGDAGPVVLSAYTAGDMSAPSTSRLVDFQNSGNFTFDSIIWQSGQSGPWGNWGDGNNYVFRRCVFLTPENTGVWVQPGRNAGVPFNLVLDRCVFGPGGGPTVMELYLNRDGTANDIRFLNCLFLFTASKCLRIFSSGATGSVGGQVLIEGCTFVGTAHPWIGEGCISTNGGGMNGLVVVRGCVFHVQGYAVNAGTSGDITEDYNVFYTASPRVNVTAGANSRVMNTAATYLGLLDPAMGLTVPYPPFTPIAGSPLLGFAATTTSTVDGADRPRPSGGPTVPAVGWVELHDYGVPSSAANADGGSGTALELTGRMDYQLLVPVDPVSTTISVKVKWDANHGDTNPPQAQLLPAPELGYSGQTITATAPGTSYQTLTFTAFTPSRKGIVVLRLISRAANSNGKCWFDTVTVS
jgi:hypothetical protein